MTDEKEKGRKNPDETSELTIGDLELLGAPNAEIPLEEVDGLEELPARPGLGLPGRSAAPKGRGPSATLRNAAAPVIGAAASSESKETVDAPQKKLSRPPPPPRMSKPTPPVAKSTPSRPPPPISKTPSHPPGVKRPPARPSTEVKHSAPIENKPPPSAPPPPAPPATDDSAEELRALCERELETKPPAERAARLSYELGRLYEIELDDATKSAEHYQATLRHAPDHAAALRGARRTLAVLGRHAALPALFDAEIKITREPAARARLLYAKARVMEEQLRQAGPALAVYREALALDPGNLAVLKAVERALRRDKAWGPLATIYEQLANAVEDTSLRAAWTAVRARLTETELKDPVQAAALYEAALASDPNATNALASVKRLSVSQKRWPQLASALRHEHDLCRDPEARLAILTTIARIEERRLGDAEAAIKTLEQAVLLRPEERSLFGELARLHRAAGRHGAEAEALARLAEQTPSGDGRAAICVRVARIHEQELRDTDRARPWYERALAEDPTHRAAALALAHIYGERGDHAAVVKVWTARAEAITAPRERADIHHRIAVLLERKLSRTTEAIEHHARSLGLDPDHPAAFDDLTRLYAQESRWLELAELYRRAVDRASHEEGAVAGLFRLGGLLEDRLGDAEGALAVYEQILARDPKNLGALHAVARAAERAKRWDRLAQVLFEEASRIKDRGRAHALQHRAAEVLADGLADPAAASRALEAILAEDPKHRPSLETLAQLLSDAGKWDELVQVYKRLLPLVASAAEKVRILYRVGEIQETQLGQDADAIASYREALRLDSEFEPAKTALFDALEQSGAPEELAIALEERMARAASPRERARAATELGVLYEEKLKKRPQALEAYAKALEAVPLYRPALDARERLLTEASNWKELVPALTEEAERSEDPFLSMHAALRAALVLAEQQGAVAPALEAFRPVFTARPDHVGALLAVEEIYARTRDDEGLAATYEKMADIVTDPKAKLAALSELARARAARGVETADVHRRILRLAADDAVSLEALASEAVKSGDRDTLLAMQARLASTAAEPMVGAFHQARVGEILLQDGDAGGALAAFRAALDLDPRSIAATRGLTRAARRAKNPDALRQAARAEEEVTRDRDVAVGLLLEASTLRRESGDLTNAAEDCERALALDADSQAAAAGLRAARRSAEEVPKLIEHLSRAAQAAKNPARACSLHLDVAQLAAESRGDLPAAVAATQRALAIRPDDGAALARLAAYLERNGQWREAADALEKVIAKARDEELVEAHLHLATIAEQHLGDLDTAIKSLRAVLKRQPDRPDALVILVRLERAKGRDEEALRVARKLIDVATDEKQKAEALSEIAQLEIARGQHAAAAQAAVAAVTMQGPRSPAARVYRDLVVGAPQHANWDEYAGALMAYLEHQKPKGTELSSTYRELARVFGEAHNRPDRAIATLREGVAACPEDPEIALALVDALAKLSAHDKALEEIRRLLAYDVRVPKAWRAMAERVRALGEAEGAAVVLAPLIALNEATDEEAKKVRGRALRVAQAPAGILAEGGLKQLTGPGALDSTAAHLTIALGDVFAKLEGADHERLGLTKRDRLRPGDAHVVRNYADRIAAIFGGVGEYDLFLAKSGVEHAVILPGGTPTLLVPAALERAKESVLAFELARPLALLSRQLHAVDGLAPEAVARILTAAVRQYAPEFHLGNAGPELDAETRRVGKAIPWLQRGRIQDAAGAFAAQPVDALAWVKNVKRMAARAALLVCDDLLSAIEALREPLGPDNTASDLARFWVSDPAMRFRRAVAQQI